MIPFAPIPTEVFIIIALFLVATVVWLGWTMRLVFSPKARGSLIPLKAVTYIVLAAMSALTVKAFYDMRTMKAGLRAQYQPVLTQPTIVGGLEMPAGTELSVTTPGNMETFNRARFPHAIDIGGIQALSATRYLNMETDADYKVTGFTPQTIRITGQGEVVKDGWRCDTSHPVEFTTRSNGAIDGFVSCTAAQGNHIQGAPLPPGSEIRAINGTRYGDGTVEPDRWLIYVPDDAEFAADGKSQRGGTIRLDARRILTSRRPRYALPSKARP